MALTRLRSAKHIRRCRAYDGIRRYARRLARRPSRHVAAVGTPSALMTFATTPVAYEANKHRGERRHRIDGFALEYVMSGNAARAQKKRHRGKMSAFFAARYSGTSHVRALSRQVRQVGHER